MNVRPFLAMLNISSLTLILLTKKENMKFWCLDFIQRTMSIFIQIRIYLLLSKIIFLRQRGFLRNWCNFFPLSLFSLFFYCARILNVLPYFFLNIVVFNVKYLFILVIQLIYYAKFTREKTHDKTFFFVFWSHP